MNNQQREFNQDRFRKDWLANKVVTATGWLVLATFILIIWHIFSHAFPLFKTPSAALVSAISLEQKSHTIESSQHPLLLQKSIELNNGLHVLGQQSCDLVLLQNTQRAKEGRAELLEAQWTEEKRFPFACGNRFVFPEQNDSAYVGVISINNLFELYKLNYIGSEYTLTLESSIAISAASISSTSDLEYRLSISNNFVMLALYYIDKENIDKKNIDKKNTDNKNIHNKRLHTYWFDKLRPDDFVYKSYEDIRAYALLPRSRQLVTFSENIWSLINMAGQIIDRQILASPVAKIFVSPSQRSLYSVDNENQMTKWLMVNEDGNFVFRANIKNQAKLTATPNAMVFDPNSSAALLFFVDKLSNGQHAFVNRLTNEVFSPQNSDAQVGSAIWRGTQLIGLAQNKLLTFELANLQGITTFNSLVNEVWYEGYDQPEYVWQTSSSSPHYETKMSLMPLIVGSLKASLLALVVAIPLALGAAIYTSFFADPSVRNYIKPSIEMLEAVPSVVIGFIAAVWLVPIAEEFLLSVILFIVLLPLVLITSAILQPKIAKLLNDRLEHKWELLFISLGVLLLGLFCFSLSDVWRYLIFDGDGGEASSVQLLNISKTTIVVAIALGVAISPSIYSLAEDALFEVPDGIKQASYALGATKLQTLRSVIITVAFPSILSAVMLGFGRAFGETMIVLMVTGNTAISDWSILEGLRSMTANLAIELSEASSGSSHFNTLFLTAGVLFIFTFFVNTAAEILRKRLRLLYHYD